LEEQRFFPLSTLFDPFVPSRWSLLRKLTRLYTFSTLRFFSPLLFRLALCVSPSFGGFVFERPPPPLSLIVSPRLQVHGIPPFLSVLLDTKKGHNNVRHKFCEGCVALLFLDVFHEIFSFTPCSVRPFFGVRSAELLGCKPCVRSPPPLIRLRCCFGSLPGPSSSATTCIPLFKYSDALGIPVVSFCLLFFFPDFFLVSVVPIFSFFVQSFFFFLFFPSSLWFLPGTFPSFFVDLICDNEMAFGPCLCFC